MLKVVSNRLQTTRNKVSRRWAKYRKVKKKVLQRKSLSSEEKQQILLSERGLARVEIKDTYQQYQGFKFARIHKSDIENFYYTKTVRTTNTIQKIYRAKRGYSVKDLDKVAPSLLSQDRVKGFLAIFKVVSEETDQSQYVSQYITKEIYDKTIENNETIYEYVANRLQAGNTRDYRLKFIYLRVIYEKS